MSNKLSFIAIIPATLLFYAILAATNLALAVDTETGTNVFFSFVHKQEPELRLSEQQDSGEKVPT